MALRGRSSRNESVEGGARVETYIDVGCELVGELRFKESVRIDGRVEGEIEGAKQVIVGEAASIEAGIRAEEVVIFGSVQGDIQVRRKVILHKTARVTGEIRTAGIVVEEGARFEGCIVIGREESGAINSADPAAAPADSGLNPGKKTLAG